MAMELARIESSLPSDSLAKINSEISAATLQRLSQSYGYLMDGILAYLADYNAGEARGKVMIGKFVPCLEDRDNMIRMDDVIVINDSFNNFCHKAGLANPMQRQALINEIRGVRKGQTFPGFSTIGITQLVRNKENGELKMFAFRQLSFLDYEITTKPMSRVENLRNVKGDPTRGISKIKLQLNHELFKAALIRKRGSGTRGYIMLPEKLESKLRNTARSHKADLQAFCKAQGFYYNKGTGYTKATRSLFNMLSRETAWRRDRDGFMVVKKPIRNVAAACCEKTFCGGDPNGEFRRRWAVEVLTFALEVMKLLFQDGVRSIEIADYNFTKDHMIVRMRHYGGGGDGPQPN